ncbi:DELLA protein RGL1-like [Diospyros lotus]|uniref:DELLA protein RGL1-like n=1 Tax=Diospyros lotus TaxID=55363 RepID=UPI00224D0E4F|nr:DELLA protein RGL1-like [Diospyros lotus]
MDIYSLNIHEIQGGYNSCTGYQKEDGWNKRKQDQLGFENWEEIDSFCSKYGFYQENISEKTAYLSRYEAPPPLHGQDPQPPRLSNTLGNYQGSTSFLPIMETAKPGNIQQVRAATPVETKREEEPSSCLASFELLSNYASGFKKPRGEKDSNRGHNVSLDGRKLSTEEIMRLAGERYIEFSSQRVDDPFMVMHPYSSDFSGLSVEQTRDVELAHLLLAAAEKVGYQQFERASRLLDGCHRLASNTGSPAQRIVFYFTEALRERISRETGSFRSRRMERKEKYSMPCLAMSSNPVFLKCHQELPFAQATVFAGIQAIVENVALKTKIHLIDLQIRSGVQWAVLIQALADRVSRPIEHLKITALGTIDGQMMEETGRTLGEFARSLNLPFSFNVVLLSDMKDLSKEHLEIEAGEAVVVYSQSILRSMISRPDCLESVMRVIRRLNPCIMVVVEVEANHNSPSFFNRFTEALFFYSALFDCLEDCTDRDSQYRFILEGVYFGDGINNTVAAEGEERLNRNVKLNVWRAFFARYGMVEIGLSESALYQANLIIKQFACGNSCTLDSDGKCLIVGWKGTPIHSLSIWKFN